jgi:hypothetical protein
MPDWHALVRSRLGRLGLSPACERDVVAEVADHLEDRYVSAKREGLGEDEAIAIALEDVPDWAALNGEIRKSRREEVDMNDRARSLWVPGFATLTLSMVALMVAMRAGLQPVAVWVSATQPLLLYVLWLVILPVFGALGAYWSQRVGGSLRARLLAGVFPAASMLVYMLALFLLTFAIDLHVPASLKFTSLGVYILGWVLIPGAALFLGALPFLFERSRTSPQPDQTRT